jgi:hypothetical protein
MTTPAGLWAKPQQRLASMLSRLAPFQTFVGAATEAEALARIHYQGLPEPSDTESGQYTLDEWTTYRPCAIVAAPDEDSWEASRIAEQAHKTSGKVVVIFLQSVATTNHGLPTADQVVSYRNSIGAILGKAAADDDDGLLDLAWQSPNLAIRRIYLHEGPYWGDPEDVQDEGVWLGSTWIVEW